MLKGIFLLHPTVNFLICYILVFNYSRFFLGKTCKLAIAAKGQVVVRGSVIPSANPKLEIFGFTLGEDNWAFFVDVVLEGDGVLPI